MSGKIVEDRTGDFPELDTLPPPSEPERYADDAVHSSELLVEDSERDRPSERTPVVAWMRQIPPPLPRPS